MVATELLKLAMETEEGRKERLKKTMKEKQVAQVSHGDGRRKKNKTEEDGS